jgi:hypothetical protein
VNPADGTGKENNDKKLKIHYCYCPVAVLECSNQNPKNEVLDSAVGTVKENNDKKQKFTFAMV